MFNFPLFPTAIFIVLFGFAYPDEQFPGNLKGKNCALLSIVYICWSLVGYCGAHHQKFSFLLIYSGLVVFYVFANIIIFGLLATKPWLDANLFWSMVFYFSLLMAIGLLHAYQIRLKEERAEDPLGYGYNPAFNYGGTYMGSPLPSHLIANPALQTQMPLYNAANLQNNFANNLPNNLIGVDNAQLYSMPNYNLPNNLVASTGGYQAPQAEPASSSRGNYFQRNWQRMSSKRMGNLFNRSSTYRPNGNISTNLITTEMKPMTFNTSMNTSMHPYG